MKNSQLVVLCNHLMDPVFDLRYAGNNNIAHKSLYEESFVPQLSASAAHALASAESFFIQRGFRLVIWDAFRPAQVQKQLRQLQDDDRFVLEQSRHNKGMAVDVTLASKTGNYLDMGTDFDDFGDKAYFDAEGLTTAQIKNRKLLNRGMSQAHFTQWPYEWWHFDYLK
jgi:D-alanyl-D-alanine dipeptidase